MHECPECGQACHCNGDIDDASVMSEEWVYSNCECCDGSCNCGDDESDFDNQWPGDY